MATATLATDENPLDISVLLLFKIWRQSDFFNKIFIWIFGTSATLTSTRQLIHYTTHTCMSYTFHNMTILLVHFNSDFCEKKSFSGTGIWTYDLPTCVFLPGHNFPYRDLNLSDEATFGSVVCLHGTHSTLETDQSDWIWKYICFEVLFEKVLQEPFCRGSYGLNSPNLWLLIFFKSHLRCHKLR